MYLVYTRYISYLLNLQSEILFILMTEWSITLRTKINASYWQEFLLLKIIYLAINLSTALFQSS